MAHLPFMQFYPADWTQDTQALTLEAQGAWIKILCAMWIAPERGSITFTKRQLYVFFASVSDAQTELITDDLRSVADVFMRDENDNVAECWADAAEITFKSRRMIREEAKRIQGLEADKRYREAKTSKKRPRNVRETSSIYQKSEVRNQKSDKEKETASPYGFAEFWIAYPKHGSRKQAEQVWGKLKPSIELLEKILAAVAAQKAWRENAGGEFRPEWQDAHRWLKNRRWEDEVASENGNKTDLEEKQRKWEAEHGREYYAQLTKLAGVPRSKIQR